MWEVETGAQGGEPEAGTEAEAAEELARVLLPFYFTYMSLFLHVHA